MNITKLKFSQLRPLLIADIQADIPALLLGRSGIGKSSLLRSLARDFQTEVFSIQINQLGETSDLTGIRLEDYIDQATGEKHYRMSAFPHAIIDECIQYAKNHPKETPILFLDEFNRTTPAITSAVLSFTTERRIGTQFFPENIRFVLAGNDTGNINTIDEASITRFAIFKVEPDVETLIKERPDLNEHIKNILLENPQFIVTDQQVESTQQINTSSTDDDDDDDDRVNLDDILGFDSDGFNQITVPRTITAASTFLNHIGIDGSGSDVELDALKQMMDIVTDSENNSNTLLYIALASHAGTTPFTKTLHDTLQDYLQKNALSGMKRNIQQDSKEVAKLRPEQQVINTLAHATTSDEIVNLYTAMNDKEKMNALIWLFVTKNINEINNYDAVKVMVEGLSKSVNNFESEHIQAIASLVAMKHSVDANIVQLALQFGGAGVQKLNTFISELA